MAHAISYRNINVKHIVMCLGAVIVILFTCCNNDKQTHENHETVAIDTENHDSMAGMEKSRHNHQQPDTNIDGNDVTNLSEDDSLHDQTYWLSQPTNEIVVSRQQTIKPGIGDTGFSIAANGYITFDPRRNYKVPVRVGGRIERLYVKYNYQYVRKGEKILELYSPELNTYIDEYLYLTRNTTDSPLQNRAKDKLLLLGLTPSQVKQVDKEGEVLFTIPMYSPVDGYVLFDPSGADAAMGGQAKNSVGMNMTTGPNSSLPIQGTNLADNSIRERMYVSKDQTLFWINDFKEVWGVLAFNKQNEKYVKKGQVAVVQSELFPDQPFRGVIQFTEPAYQQGQKFTQARIYISNSKGILKQNSLLRANILLSSKAMVLPASSVMYLGRVAIVWVQTGTTKGGSNVFMSRVVKLGRKSENQVEILDGLQPNESVAKDASYLADSETLIKY